MAATRDVSIDTELSAGMDMEPAVLADGDCRKVQAFDTCNVQARCREMLRRISLMSNPAGSLPWKWDILELLEESRGHLNDVRKANSLANAGNWKEVHGAVTNEHTTSTLPVGLRKQCEELLGRREMWILDFDAELQAILAHGGELRERILFEDVDRAGWFSASGVSPLEVQRLLERHLDMHQRATRLASQLKLASRALQQQGAISSRRRAFQAKSMGEKLQSSLVCLAAVAVAPVPGSSEMWLATTTMMWLDKDQAWQHVVYEHPRDADTETILNQFQCRSSKARRALLDWLAMPPEKRRGCALVHNASVRRVIVKTHIVSHIDGAGDTAADWTSALDSHPLGSVMKKALSFSDSPIADDHRVVIGAQRLAVVPLPPKPDTNWGWRGAFAYGDTKVGECALKEGGVFSFICVDCGLRVGDRDEQPQEAGVAVADSNGKGDAASNGATFVEGAMDDVGAAAVAMDGQTTSVEVVNGTGATFVEGATDDVGAAAVAMDGQTTSVEVVNGTDETIHAKVFEHGKGHASRLFRSPLGEGTVGPDSNRVFELKVDNEGVETHFDVEVRIGSKKAKCEVAGEQVVFVDGGLVDL